MAVCNHRRDCCRRRSWRVCSPSTGLVRRRNRTQEAWSEIDVELKRRHDLIPNLVETVKGLTATHEQGTFEAVTAARGSVRRCRLSSPPFIWTML